MIKGGERLYTCLGMSHILFHLVGRTKEQVLNVSTKLVSVDETKERLSKYAYKQNLCFIVGCICFLKALFMC